MALARRAILLSLLFARPALRSVRLRELTAFFWPTYFLRYLFFSSCASPVDSSRRTTDEREFAVSRATSVS